MGSAVEYQRWTRAAVLWQAIAEPNRDPKRRPEAYKVSDVHPYMKAKAKADKLQLPAAEVLKMFLPRGQNV